MPERPLVYDSVTDLLWALFCMYKSLNKKLQEGNGPEGQDTEYKRRSN